MSFPNLVHEISLTDPRIHYEVVPASSSDSVQLLLTFAHPPALLSHIAFLVHDSQQANQHFSILSIQVKKTDSDNFASAHHYEVPGIDPHIDFQDVGSIAYIPCVGVSQTLRLAFSCSKPEYDEFDLEVAAISQRAARDQHWGTRIFQESYSAIALIGYRLAVSPPASQVVGLLNICSYLRDFGQAGETEFLAGLALMNARRFVQGAEMIRRAEAQLITALELPLNSPRHLANQQLRTPTATTNKLLLKAAKYELLVAEGFNQHGQSLDKLIAYQQATELYLGGIQLQAVDLGCDVYTSLMRLQPHLCRLLLRNMQDTLEPLKIACIRGLEFLIEHLGCALGGQLPHILKTVIKAYPFSQIVADSFNTSLLSSHSFSEVMRREDPSPSLIDSFNRLLETFLMLLSSASPTILHSLFSEVLGNYLLVGEIPKELRIYLARISEKIATICEGDLTISTSFLSGLIALKSSEESNEAVLQFWESVKAKVLPHYSGSRLSSLVDWLQELLGDENDENTVEIGLEIVMLLSTTDVCRSPLIKLHERQRPELYPLLVPLQYWLEYSGASHTRLELFKKVWVCMTNVAKHSPGARLGDYVLPLLEKTKEFCRSASPPQAMLQFLETVLSSLEFAPPLEDFFLEFFPVFLQCILSNVQDDVFRIFNLLLQTIGANLTSELLRECINTLLHQYTVKSVSQKLSKRCLFELMLESQELLEEGLHFCLFDNRDDLPDSSHLDKQQVLQQHDSFLEKITFAIELLSLLNQSHLAFVMERLDIFAEAVEGLLQNSDSHVRIRALEVLRLLGELALGLETQERMEMMRLVTSSVKRLIEDGSDSKSAFYALQLLDLVFKHVIPPSSDRAVSEIRVSECLKLWQGVAQQIVSPWSNVRAVAFSVLCCWVQVDLRAIRPALQMKLKSLLMPLLSTLLASKESESRAGALNIMGSFCGLNVAEDAEVTYDRFQLHSDSIPFALWEHVFHLQDDWDAMIREAAAVLVQLSGPRDSVRHLTRVQRQNVALRMNAMSDEEMMEEEASDGDIFWAQDYTSDQLKELASIFRTDSKNPSQLWNEIREPREEVDREEPHVEIKVDEEEESFEQLGVIDIGDDELLEGCDDEANQFPVIKNAYQKRKQEAPKEEQEDHTWSRSLRPHNASLRPFTPPAKPSADRDWGSPSEEHKADFPATRQERQESLPLPQPQPEPKERSLSDLPEEELDEGNSSMEEILVPGHIRRSSLDELAELLGNGPSESPPSPEEQKGLEVYSTSPDESAKKSPSTPKRRLDQDLASRLKYLTTVPTGPSLSKIYMQKPDLSQFKKKPKPTSLNTSLSKTKKQLLSKVTKPFSAKPKSTQLPFKPSRKEDLDRLGSY